MNVLVTGAAGYIGRIVARDLAQHHHVRGVDMRPMSALKDHRVIDLNDYDEIYDALEGMDAIAPGSPRNFEMKWSGPDDVVIDISHTGWLTS